ncbi:MAG: O-antigen ligase family protein [Planctomycetaceae bacterium]
MRSPLTIFAMALLTAAFLWPTEDAVNGGGLHLVILWLTLGGLVGLRYLMNVRHKQNDSLQMADFGIVDFGVLLILIGHVLSTAYVFYVEGDRRSALNLTFEWAGLFVAWRIFRHLSLDRLQSVQAVQVLITILVGLAVMGIWQHHVFYPQQAAWYRGERSALDKALAEPEGMGLFRVSEIVASFQSKGIPLDGTDRVLWENRLLSSSEPFATFSLANTLAGVLASSLVLVIGQSGFALSFRRPWKSTASVIPFLQAALILYCLVLTKSRSAWAGALVGLVIVIICRWRTLAAIRILHWSFSGAAFVGLIVGIAAYAGALDKEVIFESSRSLQFRLFYWTGAIETIREAPITGAGPGNFRQVYLKHKADESSEEIRDPHNFLLESWSAGGLVGFVGLLMFIFGTYRNAFSPAAVLNAGSEEIVVPKRLRHFVLKSIVAGAIVHLSWQWINGESVHLDLVERLLPLSGLFFCIIETKGTVRELDKNVCLAASVTMMVHLLAAGGFEMPVVMLMLLATSALGQARTGISIRRVESILLKRYRMCLGIAFSVLTVVIVFRFGLMDVSGVDRYLLLGDDLLHRQGNLREALVAYRQAAEADLLAVTPRQRIAELAAYVLREESKPFQRIASAAENSPGGEDSLAEQKAKAEKSFDKAVEACNFWISVDDRNSFSRSLKAECLSLGSRVKNADELLNEAIELQRRVVEMYPSSVSAWMQLIRFCRQRMSLGVLHAETEVLLAIATNRVRQLDDINHQWGHQDRYLTDDDRTLLQDAMRTQPGSSR